MQCACDAVVKHAVGMDEGAKGGRCGCCAWHPWGVSSNVTKRRRAALRRRAPQPATRAMAHRNPDADCPLCGVWGVAWDWEDPSSYGRQHEHAEALWAQWDGRRDWPARVAAAAASFGVACTEQQARVHFARHQVEQPHLSEALDRERWLAEAQGLSPRSLQVIDCLYRVRLATTRQLTEVFFRAGAKTWESAHTMARQELPALARRHFIYRYFPSVEAAGRRDAPHRFSQHAVWLLGRRSVPFIEHRYGVTVRPEHYTTMASQVSVDPLIHDLRANGLYVALARAIHRRGGVLELPGRGVADEVVKAPAWVLPSNWYSVKHLRMGFHDRAEMIDREIMPDGFATISLGRGSFRDGALPSTQLPFFLEYDHGSRTYGEVIEQLFTYDRLARSQAAGKRFPDLAVAGYAVPVVMVFSSRRRVLEAHKRFVAHARAKRIRGHAPIFLVAEDDWAADPFADGQVLHVWSDGERRHGLLEALLGASRKLIDRRALLAQQTLRLDLQGAKPTPQGSYSEAEREKRRRARADDDTQRRTKAQADLLAMLKDKASTTPGG